METSKFYLTSRRKSWPKSLDPAHDFSSALVCFASAQMNIHKRKGVRMFFWSNFIDFHFASHGFYCSSMSLHSHKGHRALHPFKQPSHFVGFFLVGLQKVLHRGVQFLCSIRFPRRNGLAIWGFLRTENCKQQKQTNFEGPQVLQTNLQIVSRWLYVTWIWWPLEISPSGDSKLPTVYRIPYNTLYIQSSKSLWVTFFYNQYHPMTSNNSSSLNLSLALLMEKTSKTWTHIKQIISATMHRNGYTSRNGRRNTVMSPCMAGHVQAWGRGAV